jgi:integrase
MAARTRKTLAEGIYQDAHGITVIARIGSHPNILKDSARYPLLDSDGVPYSKKNCAELIKCRLQLLEDLRRKRKDAGGEAGSLGAAIDQWKLAFPLGENSPQKLRDDYCLVANWRTSPLAAVPIADLKRSQVRAQLTAWTDAGRGPTTVNHRKRILADVLRWARGADDDEDVVIATDGISNLPPRPAKTRGIPMPILAYILAKMPDRGRPLKGQTRPPYSETKIRLEVMAWTGLAHKSLERLDRKRVRFHDGKYFLPDRKKGAGAEGMWADLLPAALAALRKFDDANLWGKPFSRSSMRKSYRCAVTCARKALVDEAEKTGDRTMLDQFNAAVPDNSYPYDTRHSFLTDAYEQTGDLAAVAELGQHADISTTERYTKAAVPKRVASAVEKMRARWFPDAPKPGATVREFHLVTK